MRNPEQPMSLGRHLIYNATESLPYRCRTVENASSFGIQLHSGEDRPALLLACVSSRLTLPSDTAKKATVTCSNPCRAHPRILHDRESWTRVLRGAVPSRHLCLVATSH